MIHNVKLYDNYRGLLAIIVLIGHLCATFLYPYLGATGILPDLMNFLSTWSVNIFFILSGYLITHSILRNIFKNGYFKWSDFLISRIARIYPPLIASILLSTILYWLVVYFNLHGKYSFLLPSDLYVIRDNFSFKYREIVDSLLMRGGLLYVNGALWSLYVEVRIYLVAMLIAILIKGRMGWWAKSIAFIVLFYISIKLKDSSVFVTIWMLGSVFSVIHHEKFRLPRGVSYVIFLLALIISLYYSFTPRAFLQNDNTINGFFATCALSILLAGLIFIWQVGTNFLYLFSTSAKYSYTLYIIHFPLLLFAFSLTHQMLSSNFQYLKLFIVCIVVFAVILCFAYIMASYFEDKRRFEGYIKGLLDIFATERIPELNK